MNKCKLILFDMDGVTIDTEPLYEKGETKLFAEYGVKIPLDDWKILRGCTEEKFYTISMDRYKIKEKRNIFMYKGRRYILEEFEKNLTFMKGFKKLISRIKDKYKIGLVTASPEHMFSWINSRLHLNKIFEHIVHGGMTQRSKPNPDPYLLAMNKFNLFPDNTLIIEDSINGITAAKRSNAKVIALAGSVDKNSFPVGCTVIESLDDVNISFINNMFS